MQSIKDIFPFTLNALSGHLSSALEGIVPPGAMPQSLPGLLAAAAQRGLLPPYFPDLARLEYAFRAVLDSKDEFPFPTKVIINSHLELLSLEWRLAASFHGRLRGIPPPPPPGREYVLIWRHPRSKKVLLQEATNEDLLALKIIGEGLSYREAALIAEVPVGKIKGLIAAAVKKGLLLSPPSAIRRDPRDFTAPNRLGGDYLSTTVFSLQWHVTNRCDLRCKHCYDRTGRSEPRLRQGIAVLDELDDFCRERFVGGHISFTGGNPFLYAEFLTLYREANRRGFALSILGNPGGREELEELLSIQRPRFYQISLEGMEEHNDSIRGKGHFRRALAFLDLLREMGIFSNVMLTLTADNLEQVLPLAELLRGRCDSFTFNRLSQVGEGAALPLPGKEKMRGFLKEYERAAAHNPLLRYKDNLFNIQRHQKHKGLLGGCTGYGCGAAFNFVTVLPDGEVHACRKFPSPIGNIYRQSLSAIYDSAPANQYRLGSRACDGCPLRRVCGGCMAVTHGHGRDVFFAKDPHCFMDDFKI